MVTQKYLHVGGHPGVGTSIVGNLTKQALRVPPTGSGGGEEAFLSALAGDDVAFCLLSVSHKHVSFSHDGLCAPGCKTLSRERRHEWCQLERGNKQESVPLAVLGLQVR